MGNPGGGEDTNMSKGKAGDEREAERVAGREPPAPRARPAGRTPRRAASGRGRLERSPERGGAGGGAMRDLTPLGENAQAPHGEHTAVSTRGELLTNT